MKGDQFFGSVAGRPPFSNLHPQLAAFFKDYLSNEKAIEFRGKWVVNTHFPPYPGRAFEKMVEQFNDIGDSARRQLFSVTLAVTNRCTYKCRHCYNAGRSERDLPLETLKHVSSQIQSLGAVVVTLSGGEPLLRNDLEEIIGSFDGSSSLSLNTTGAGLTADRARALHDAGLFAAGVSLDSETAEEHDRLRGRKGAFETALRGIELAADAGLYPYVISLATREFLAPSKFRSFMQFAGNIGAKEVHLLEPCPTGRLAGHPEVVLSQAERRLIPEYQKEYANYDCMPILSSFAYLESPEAFGCGAGLTHLYIDGSGEVCPCNLVPISFGNLTRETIPEILDSMGRFFRKPRRNCVGRTLAAHINSKSLPTSPEVSAEICREYLGDDHAVPRFFKLRSEARTEVGQDDLMSAYDQVSEYYDQFWLNEAAGPIRELISKLALTGSERVYEAGCGTGFATAMISRLLAKSGYIAAVDLSEGMLAAARQRLDRLGIPNFRLTAGDALQILKTEHPFDVVFSSWVLGYIPLRAFFAAAAEALAADGRVAFVVHKANSPREPIEIFGEIVAKDPSVLQKRVWFDFPRDKDHVEYMLRDSGFEVEHLSEGEVTFCYDNPDEVLEHLLKSGAGTAFYNALDPKRRKAMESEFLERLGASKRRTYEVVHDYIACIAGKRDH